MTTFHPKGTIGLDLSLRSAAAAFIPDDWDINSSDRWNHVRTVSVGYPLPKGSDHEARVKRLHFITSELASWVGPTHKGAGIHVYVEDYAYGLAGQSGMVLGELGGAVKVALYNLGHVVVPANQSTVRKFLLGNWARTEHGLPGLTLG